MGKEDSKLLSTVQNRFNGNDLRDMFKASMVLMERNLDAINSLNVFPVPDGDTGTNMCFTLLPIVEYPQENIPKHAGKVFNIMADLALESARGNSGTIIAQFFHGMRKTTKNKEKLYINDFAIALKSGYQSAIDSLINPKEGTIITVMRDVSDKANELIKDETINFKTF